MGVAEMLAELAKREKQAGIFPEKDVDVYMKVRFYSCNSLDSLWDYPVESLILSKLLNALLNDADLYFCFGCTGNSSGRNAEQPLHRLHHEGYIHITNFQRQIII